MKKCPYCAEEIQEEAIKCKHCGEWLKEDFLKKELNHFEDKSQLIQSPPVELNKVQEKNKENISSVFDLSLDNKEFKPKKKSKYGWAWFILLGSFAQYLQKDSFYIYEIEFLGELIIILILIFYFWFRRILLTNQRGDPQKKWKPPLYASLVSYLIFSIFMVGLHSIDGYKKGQDINNVFNEKRMELIKSLSQEEEDLRKNIISNPQSLSDLDKNSLIIDRKLEILDKKIPLFGYIFSKLEAIYSKDKHDKGKLELVLKNKESFNSCSQRLKITYESLKKLYLTKENDYYLSAQKASEDSKKYCSEFKKNWQLLTNN